MQGINSAAERPTMAYRYKWVITELRENKSLHNNASLFKTPIIGNLESAWSFTAWKVSVFWVFLVRIFPYLDWIRRNNPCLSVFILNTGKYVPEKLRIRTLFTQNSWSLLRQSRLTCSSKVKLLSIAISKSSLECLLSMAYSLILKVALERKLRKKWHLSALSLKNTD